MKRTIRFPLETARLTIRPLDIGDSAALHQLDNDPVAMRHLASSLPTSVVESEQWVQDKVDLHDETGLSLWGVVLSETDDVIGDVGLHLLEGGETVEVGVRLIRRFWGNGYGREAAAARVEASFRDLGLSRIVGITGPDNKTAIAAMCAGGMTDAGMETHYGREWVVLEITANGVAHDDTPSQIWAVLAGPVGSRP